MEAGRLSAVLNGFFASLHEARKFKGRNIMETIFGKQVNIREKIDRELKNIKQEDIAKKAKEGKITDGEAKNILKEEARKKVLEAFLVVEADVIVTAVVLGFIGTRYHQKQPCRFDFEHPGPEWFEENKYYGNVGGRKMKLKKEEEYLNELQQFDHVLSALSFIVDKSESGMGSSVKDGQSPEWNPTALITGRAGGQMLNGNERHKEMQMESSRSKAKPVGEKPASLPKSGPDALYLGKGAYTGMIDDPVKGETLIQRTKRVIDPDEKRWRPGADALPELTDDPWGLIDRAASEKNNDGAPKPLKELEKGGLGQLPDNIEAIDKVRVGYIHGMTAAIVKSVAAGPWCTPYELAAGTETTKMASCFPCTTYMYANGFPPSSTHLGRGESWIPPKPGLLSGEKESEEKEKEKDEHKHGMPEYLQDNISGPLIERWNWDIYHYLCLGGKYLSNAISATRVERKRLERAGISPNVIDYVNGSHHDAVEALNNRLEEMKKEDIGKVGGNLFLDALTVHDSEWKRVRRTLEPVCNKYFNQIEKPYLENEIAKGNILLGAVEIKKPSPEEPLSEKRVAEEYRLIQAEDEEEADLLIFDELGDEDMRQPLLNEELGDEDMRQPLLNEEQQTSGGGDYIRLSD
jgi:hypothetical protein